MHTQNYPTVLICLLQKLTIITYLKNKEKAHGAAGAIVRLMLAAWLAMKLISWRLWLPFRTLPSAPVVPLPATAEILLSALFIIFLIIVLIKPISQLFLMIFIAGEVLIMLGDQVRWQPWEYQFLFIALAVAVHAKQPARALNAIILILASTYLFSGLQKMSGLFLTNVWEKLILVMFLHLSPSFIHHHLWLHYAGLCIPCLEIAAGILLIFRKQHILFALLPIGMHLFIVVLLSPLGIHYNMIVIPWNLAMAAFVYLIFIHYRFHFSIKDIAAKENWLFLFVWLALPAAGLFGYWDKYFSSAVYAGDSVVARIFIRDTTMVPAELQPYVRFSKKGHRNVHHYISLTEWSLDEMTVPVPPQKRIYNSLYKSFAHQYAELSSFIVFY